MTARCARHSRHSLAKREEMRTVVLTQLLARIERDEAPTSRRDVLRVCDSESTGLSLSLSLFLSLSSTHSPHRGCR